MSESVPGRLAAAVTPPGLALLLSFCGCSSAAENQADWLETAQIGITSPLATCQQNSGCTPLTNLFPLLYLEVLSDRVIAIGLADTPDSTRWLERLASASVHPDDPGDDLGLTVEQTGSSRASVGFDGRHRSLDEWRIYLLLSQPLRPGQDLRLTWPGESPSFIEFPFTGQEESRSLQVNQVGYLPLGSKRALAGNWLGTAGPMPLEPVPYQLVDAETGRIALEGSFERLKENDPWSGNRVLVADFSQVQEPGRYRIQAAGLGHSSEFSIDQQVYKPVYETLFRLFYHHRNSTPIIAPWAHPGYERPAGTPNDQGVRIHPSVVASPFYRGESPQDRRPLSRGWFDAGDYGQYVANAAPVWYAFGLGLDVGGDALRRDDLGIPESGNGIPDLLDELEWGMDWLLAMQDPNDGGVYSRLVPESWDSTLPQQSRQPRYLFEKTTHATASFAAATALHARLIEPFRPEHSAVLLNASRQAWAFLEKTSQWPAEGDVYRNPPGVHAGEYQDDSAIDNRLWAAAELYRTTKESAFEEHFWQLFLQVNADPTSGVSFRRQEMAAYWAMVMAIGVGSNPEACKFVEHDKTEHCESMVRTIRAAADWSLRKASENPWQAPVHQHIPFLGWGTFAHSSRAILPLYSAWKLFGENRYRDQAPDMVHTQLGLNPQSVSFITGVGTLSPRYPLSKLSQYAAASDPLPGIPVNGPQFHLPELWDAMRSVNAGYFPQANVSPGELSVAYPPLRRYVDSKLLPPMSEPTVAELAVAVIAFGLVSGSD